MSSHPYPDFIARFYDLIYKKVRQAEDIQFYLDCVAQSKGPVLEVGVGTGRLFVPALESGADIFGIDLSPSMIMVLKEKIPHTQHYRLSVQDLCQLEMERRFTMVLAPFRMFSHLVEVEDQMKALEKVYDHLEDGGTFIFDLYVPDYSMLSKGIENLVDFEGEYAPGKKISRRIDMHADPIRQISYVTMTLEWIDEDGKTISKAWEFPMRYFFRYEIEHLLALSPLKLITLYGDYQRNPLRTNAKEFIIVCGK